MHLRESIEKLENVDGFVAAGVFGEQGELIEELSLAGNLNLKEIGALTSEALKKTLQLTGSMGAGSTRFLHMTSTTSNILARCLSNRPDASSRTIAHIVLVLGPRGATALGKLKLNSVADEIAGDLGIK